MDQALVHNLLIARKLQLQTNSGSDVFAKLFNNATAICSII